MAFPINPSSGTTYENLGRSWFYNGYAWNRYDPGITGSSDVGVMYLKGNTFTTTIPSINAREIVVGGITTGTLYNFQKHPTTNSLQYLGSGGRFHVIATFNFETENSNNTCGFYIGHNKNISSGLSAIADRISESEIYVHSSNSNKPVTGAIQTVVDLNTDDRLFFIVQNKDAAKYILVEFLKFVVTPIPIINGSNDVSVFNFGGQITGSYVSSLSGITGDVFITGGTGISITRKCQYLIVSASGITGPAGATGSIGDYVISINGFTGGITLFAGNGITFQQTIFGITLSTIAGIGNTGPTGPTGEQGIQGIQGIQGLLGNTGNTGIQGIQGIQGLQGTQGIQGVVGNTGSTGTVNFGLTYFAQNTGITKAAAFTTGTTGLARKAMFLLQDGGLTLDYIRNYDVFNPSDLVFAISSFTTSLSSNYLIGATAFNFSGQTITVAYSAVSVPTGATFAITSGVGFGFPVVLSSPYTSYTFPSTGFGVTYTTPPQSLSFRLTATDGTTVATTTSSTFTFVNNIYYGVSTDTNLSTVTGLITILSNTKNRTLPSVNPGAGEYIYYVYPARLGTSTFTVGGFEGGFESPQTYSVTNANGYTESYYFYRSTNPNLGSTTVVVS